MSLRPDQVERLRKKLYEKAKREPDFRFYSLYDKVCWIETLQQAYRKAKSNAGAAGVDGVRFEDIEAYGVDRWLAELQQELMEERYQPQPVRRVMIPKRRRRASPRHPDPSGPGGADCCRADPRADL
jgi:RNA-directed DNA polymerase